jgi:hypothetical protein
MIIPNFENIQLVDRNGMLTEAGQLLFQNLFSQLQLYISNEGLKIPQQTAANIALLNTSQSVGNLLYDSDNDLAKVNINGTFKTIQTA